MINIYNNNQWQNLGTFAERVTSYPVTSTNSFNGDFPTIPASEYTPLIIKNVGSSDINDIVSPVATGWNPLPGTGFYSQSTYYVWKSISSSYYTWYKILEPQERTTVTFYTNKIPSSGVPNGYSGYVKDTGSYPTGTSESIMGRTYQTFSSTGVTTPYRYYCTVTYVNSQSYKQDALIQTITTVAQINTAQFIREGEFYPNPNAKSITISVTNGGTTTTYPITLDTPLTPNSTITRNINTPTGATTISVDNPNVIVYVPFDSWINSLNTIHVYNNGSWQ